MFHSKQEKSVEADFQPAAFQWIARLYSQRIIWFKPKNKDICNTFESINLYGLCTPFLYLGSLVLVYLHGGCQWPFWSTPQEAQEKSHRQPISKEVS